MGYGPERIRSLRETILQSDAEVIVSGSPIDLSALLNLDRPVVRARYAFEEAEEPGLGVAIDSFLESLRKNRS